MTGAGAGRGECEVGEMGRSLAASEASILGEKRKQDVHVVTSEELNFPMPEAEREKQVNRDLRGQL